MIEVEILAGGNEIIRLIGEELIKESSAGLKIDFVEEPSGRTGVFLIIGNKYEEKEKYVDGRIVLCEEGGGEGISLLQPKARIKSEILGRLQKEGSRRDMLILSGNSPYSLWKATVFCHFLAVELAKEGHRVFLLSFNLDFPFESLGWTSGSKGLLKALYYHGIGEDFNPGIVKRHQKSGYDYLEVDIRAEEAGQLTEDFVRRLAAYIGSLGYSHLVLDYGVLYWLFLRLEDHMYFLKDGNDEVPGIMETSHLLTLSAREDVEVVDGENLFKMKRNKRGIMNFYLDREGLKSWKNNLRKK